VFPAGWEAAAAKPSDTAGRSSDSLRDESDEVLVRGVARGDDLAFAELVTRYQRRLTEFVRWSLDDASNMTEDVLQEIFWQLHRSAGRFAGQSSFRTWLYALARNVCSHQARQLRHEPAWMADATDEALTVVPASTVDPFSAIAREEVVHRVRVAVEALPVHHRLVLMLRDWEELSYAEIAEVLDLPVGTVRSRLHNARASLADLLAETK
jgi:RNA polymerase sigma-70 factor (ECF subfamily)